MPPRLASPNSNTLRDGTVCAAKNIKIGEGTVSVDKLCEAAKLAERIFLQVPNTFRPISGLFVNKANYGVLNIPDFLEAGGERDYFLNVVNIHPSTIKRALAGSGLDKEVENPEFIESVSVLLRRRLESGYDLQRSKYNDLMGSMLRFYQEAQINNIDLVRIARDAAGHSITESVAAE